MKKVIHRAISKPNTPSLFSWSRQDKKQATSEMAKLGQYLKRLRQDLGFSLRKTADLADISAAHLCKIEQGTTFQSVSIDVLVGLSRAYKIPLSSMLQEAGFVEKADDHLPHLAQYLRSKYNLSPQAIRDIEIAKEVVDKKYN